MLLFYKTPFRKEVGLHLPSYSSIAEIYCCPAVVELYRDTCIIFRQYVARKKSCAADSTASAGSPHASSASSELLGSRLPFCGVKISTPPPRPKAAFWLCPYFMPP